MAVMAAGMAAVAAPGAPSMQQELRNAGTSASSQPAKADRGGLSSRTIQAAFGGYGFGSRGSARRRGPGWTQAHVKRMARKARNVARNRKAHR
jgi:hypothetical protein